MPSHRFWISAGLFAVASATLAAGYGVVQHFTTPQRTMETVTKDIQTRFPDIDHITLAELDHQLAKPSNVDKQPDTQILLIDVREAEEFNVSRIPGAVRIDPGISTAALSQTLAERAKGRKVVFYCSVGERSSRLAKKSKAALLTSGAQSVHNLNGGIFSWHNTKRKLENSAGQTPYVHPFNKSWGLLVKQQSLTRYQPEIK